jgi:predicted phage terminase large subunit-like protein
MAATLPSEVYPDPDYTVGIAGTIDDMGTVYITDVVRGRWRPSGVHEEMKKTAERDGPDCTITIPVDSGAAGKQAADHTTSMLFSEGYTVRQKRTSNTAKVKRFEPVAALAENGMIKVVKAEWNEIFFDELEQFTGDGKGHDDIVDALSDLVNELVMKKTAGSFSLPDLGGLTQANPFNK